MRSNRLSAAALAGLVSTLAVAAAPQARAQIEMGALQELDAWAVGAISARDGALPKTLWRGSDATTLGATFDRVPQSLASPTASALVRRALLSSGATPVGEGAAEAARKRFSAIGRLGMAEALVQMTSGGSAASRDPQIAQFVAQGELARGRIGEACARGRAVTLEPPPAFVLRLRAFCFAAAKEQGATDLALQVASAAGASDAFLVQALPAIAGSSERKPAGRYDNSLNAAISLAGGFAPGPNALNASSALALAAVARHPQAPSELRYGAAVQALRHGIISAEVARPAIAAWKAPPTRRGQRAPSPPPLAAALQAVSAAQTDTARALAVQAALTRAEGFGAFLAAARLFQSEILSLPRTPETAPAALAMARAALALGDVQAAAAWRDIASVEASPLVRAQIDVAIAGFGHGGPEAARFALARLIDQSPSAQLGPGAARVLTLAAALGVAPPPAADGFMLVHAPAGGVRADDGLLAALVGAAQRGAIGETAVLAGLVLAPGADRLDTASLVSVIQALRAVGLEADARAVLSEAIIAGMRA